MNRQKRGRTAKGLLIAVLVLLLLALIGLAALRHTLGKIRYEGSDGMSPGSLNPSGVTNLLLIGVDNDTAAGWEDRGNADGLMLVSINEKRGRIVLTSLMRDVRVQVPDAYRTKLTLVYHDGGVPLLIDTIEQSFGVEIDGYALVNYLSVIEIVDAVGGLELELTADEAYYMDTKIQNLCELTGASYEANRLKQPGGGKVLLNGLQTAAYLRIRYAGNGDFDRTERARRVLLAIKDKAAENGIRGVKELMDTALPCISTNLSGKAITALGVKLPKLLGYEMRSERIPADGTWRYAEESYGSFVDIDLEANRAYLHRSIYD
jgi:LCP family protein required for cell wall assembly